MRGGLWTLSSRPGSHLLMALFFVSISFLSFFEEWFSPIETFHRTRALSTSIHHFHSIVVILEAHVLNIRAPCCVSEIKNIGLLWAKVRRFCPKSTEVSIKEVRCFHFPEKPLSFPPFVTCGKDLPITNSLKVQNRIQKNQIYCFYSETCKNRNVSSIIVAALHQSQNPIPSQLGSLIPQPSIDAWETDQIK